MDDALEKTSEDAKKGLISPGIPSTSHPTPLPVDPSKLGMASALTQMQADVDHDVWSSKSDKEHVTKIMERASLGDTPMDYFNTKQTSPTKPAGGGGWDV